MLFFTAASQWLHIMPSTVNVLVMGLSSGSEVSGDTLVSGLAAVVIGAAPVSLWELPMFAKFKRNALVTTQKLERLMARAANVAFRLHPKSL